MARKSRIYILDRLKKKKNQQKFLIPKQQRHFNPSWSAGVGPWSIAEDCLHWKAERCQFVEVKSPTFSLQTLTWYKYLIVLV